MNKKNLKKYTCCFTGHRKIPVNKHNIIRNRLKAEIINLINNDVKYFGCGGALGFDTIAALVVLSLKKEYPHIKLILVLPCPEQNKFWSDSSNEQYKYILKMADKIVYTSPFYTPDCMHIRNRHLVDNSCYCISYCRKNKGGTFYTKSYAIKNNLNVINI